MSASFEHARTDVVTSGVSESVVCAVWTVMAAGRTFRVKTCSARTALAHAHQRTGEPGKLVGFRLATLAPPRPREIPNTRLGRLRKTLKPEALRRREERRARPSPTSPRRCVCRARRSATGSCAVRQYGRDGAHAHQTKGALHATI